MHTSIKVGWARLDSIQEWLHNHVVKDTSESIVVRLKSAADQHVAQLHAQCVMVGDALVAAAAYDRQLKRKIAEIRESVRSIQQLMAQEAYFQQPSPPADSVSQLAAAPRATPTPKQAALWRTIRRLCGWES